MNVPRHEQTRREFLARSAMAASLAGMAGRARAAQSRPNILVLLTDDQRGDMLGCMGHPIVQTPHLDALAAEGTLFTNAFVTTSICMASRASILTGCYTTTHGIHDFQTELTPGLFAQTYPMLMRQQGYRTGFIGKWGVGNEMPADAFDYWRGFPGQGKFLHVIEGKQRHLHDITLDQAREFVGDSRVSQPWCLSVSFKAPHVQDETYPYYLYDPDLESLYEDIEIPPAALSDQQFFSTQAPFVQRSENRRRWERRFGIPELYQQSVKGYYRLVTGMDRVVGRIIELLRVSGQLENTLILFTSDNGIFNGERGLADKQLMYESSIHVPMILLDPSAPAAARGKRVEALALNIDVAPTLLDCAGLPVAPHMQGRSLRALAHGETPPWRDDFFYEHDFANDWDPPIPASEGIRTHDWKYIRYVKRDPVVEELYDLRADPGESRNLIDVPEHAAIRAELQVRWRQWREHLEPWSASAAAWSGPA